MCLVCRRNPPRHFSNGRAVPMSAHGAIHFVVAILAFIGGAFGVLFLSLQFHESTIFKQVKNLTMVLSLLSIVFLMIQFFTPFAASNISEAFGGLFERLFLGSVLLWILMVSIFAILSRPQVFLKSKGPLNQDPSEQQ